MQARRPATEEVALETGAATEPDACSTFALYAHASFEQRSSSSSPTLWSHQRSAGSARGQAGPTRRDAQRWRVLPGAWCLLYAARYMLCRCDGACCRLRVARCLVRAARCATVPWQGAPRSAAAAQSRAAGASGSGGWLSSVWAGRATLAVSAALPTGSAGGDRQDTEGRKSAGARATNARRGKWHAPCNMARGIQPTTWHCLK